MIDPVIQIKGFDNITLHRADCMEIMAGYPDNYFDLAVVDPPYGIKADNTRVASGGFYQEWTTKNNYPKKDWDSQRPSAEYFAELLRVSKLQVIFSKKTLFI